MKPTAPTAPEIREALAIFEAFRRLGFQSDDLYMEPALDPQNADPETGAMPVALGVVLKTQGKEFCVCAGLRSFPDNETMMRAVQAAGAWWNGLAHQPGGHKQAEKLWNESKIVCQTVDFLMAIIGKGIEIPVTRAHKRAVTPGAGCGD